ncbi:MAG: hypothetical protein GF368_02590 [Candidatus Aenigmarchaeota archaeon]|nr:hypothetical protein [Candidatus Aenigmarchaeota archaeon]
MSHSIKFLADENVDARLVKFLLERNVNIKYTSKGIKNSKLFSLACNEDRVLLTHDKDFMNVILTSEKTFPGIIVIRIHPPKLSKLKSSMIYLVEKFSEKDIKNRILLLSEDRVEIME